METWKIGAVAVLAAFFAMLHGAGAELLGFSEGSPLYTHFTYPAMHGSWLHLAANCYALWFVWKRDFLRPLPMMAVSYACAVAGSFPAFSSVPTVGISGMIFAMTGVELSTAITWRNLIFVCAFIMAGFVMPGTNVTVHLLSLVYGFMAGYAIRTYRTYIYDCRGTDSGK